MLAWFPVVVALVGLVLYVIPGPAKAQAIGLALITAGATGLCVAFAGRLLRIL